MLAEALTAFGADRRASDHKPKGYGRPVKLHQLWDIWWMLNQDYVEGGCVGVPRGMGKVRRSSLLTRQLLVLIVAKKFIMHGFCIARCHLNQAI